MGALAFQNRDRVAVFAAAAATAAYQSLHRPSEPAAQPVASVAGLLSTGIGDRRPDSVQLGLLLLGGQFPAMSDGRRWPALRAPRRRDDGGGPEP
ncbi:MAG TPA: hypothetical protein VKY26_03850 [Actinomycetota bacterium]|nr:hypothetical protein [Actinomycetota bacterium]